VVAIACLAAQLAGFAHAALVRHERCPVHGELMHPGEGHAHAARPGLDHDAVLAAEAAEPDAHEDCAVVASRHGLASVARSDASVDVPVALRAVELRATPRPAQFALFLLAPKSSPPAA
jgi:hypothetical protein